MKPQNGKQENSWLALAIGNSRLHWARFAGASLQEAWDTEHISDWRRGTEDWEIPLYVASVVPSQTAVWQNYPNVKEISLNRIPLKGTYPSLGVDRALALLGAGETWGWPILVIDAGTALTFTGADSDRRLLGGAILPGLSLQVRSLSQGTAALPKIAFPDLLPSRWGLDTSSAIQSGIIYTVLAGISDFIKAWWQQFPESKIVLTGGDRTVIFNYLQTLFPEVASRLNTDPYLIFWGMRSLVVGRL